MFYLNEINNGLGVRSILHFISYKMVNSCALFIFERKVLFFIRTERGKCCGWAWCCLYFDANFPLLGRVVDKK